MKKALITLVGGLALVAAVIVGGTFYAKHKIESDVRTAFAEAAKSPIIKSAELGAMTIDLLGDTVVIDKSTFTLDYGEYIKDYGYFAPDGLTAEGTMTETFGRTILSGIRTTLSEPDPTFQFVSTDVTMAADISQTFPAKSHRLSSTSRITGTIGRISITDMKLSALGNLNPDVFRTGLKRMELENWKFHQDIDHTSTASSAAETKTVNLDMLLDLVYIDSTDQSAPSPVFGMRNLSLDMTLPDRAKPQNMAVGEITAANIKLNGDKMITAGDFTMSDIKVPLPDDSDPRSQMVMALLGMSEPVIDLRINFAFDEAAQTFSLAPFQVRLQKAGALDVSVDISGVPPLELFQEIQAYGDLAPGEADTAQRLAMKTKAEAAFAALAIRSISAGYKDEGALKTFLAAQAVQAKTDMNRMAQAYALQASSLINATHGETKGNEVFRALQTFLNDPTELRLRLSSETPVKFKEFSEAFKVMGPMALSTFQLDILSP